MELTDIIYELKDQMYLLEENFDAFRQAACDDNGKRKFIGANCSNIGLYRAFENIEKMLQMVFEITPDLPKAMIAARDFAEKEVERYSKDAEKVRAFERQGNYDLWEYAKCRNEGYVQAYETAREFFDEKLVELGVSGE